MKTSYLKALLPLRDIVIFPSMVVPLFVGREKSIKALQEVMKSDKSIVLVTQKNSEIDDPSSKDLYQYGCMSKILQLLKLPDGTVKVLVEGEKRVRIIKHSNNNNFLTCEVETVDDENVTKESDQFAIGLVKKFERLQVLSKKDFNDSANSLRNLKDASQIANNISSNLNIQIFEKQELLEITDLKKRLEKIVGKEIINVRQHWLRFSWEKTWKAQKKAGLKSDFTLMFNDRSGFRNSTALSFSSYYESKNHKSGGSSFMDANPDRDNAFDKIVKELNACFGETSILWHNHTLSSNFGWYRSWRRCLNILKS